jgi:hypothetical protein
VSVSIDVTGTVAVVVVAVEDDASGVDGLSGGGVETVADGPEEGFRAACCLRANNSADICEIAPAIRVICCAGDVLSGT